MQLLLIGADDVDERTKATPNRCRFSSGNCATSRFRALAAKECPGGMRCLIADGAAACLDADLAEELPPAMVPDDLVRFTDGPTPARGAETGAGYAL